MFALAAALGVAAAACAGVYILYKRKKEADRAYVQRRTREIMHEYGHLMPDELEPVPGKTNVYWVKDGVEFNRNAGGPAVDVTNWREENSQGEVKHEHSGYSQEDEDPDDVPYMEEDDDESDSDEAVDLESDGRGEYYDDPAWPIKHRDLLRDPYVIDLDDFCDSPEWIDGQTVYFYEKDGQFIDALTKSVLDDSVFGACYFAKLSELKRTLEDARTEPIYIRNEKLGFDYEVILS